MKIINTYIGDDEHVPEYTKLSLRQARYFNPDLEIDFICKHKQDYFDELNINWVAQDEISSNLLKDFNDVCWFKREGIPQTTYPSQPMFWHRTAERIFYLQRYIEASNSKDVVHFENDNLIYDSVDKINIAQDKINVVPVSPILTGFGICSIPDSSKLGDLCQFMVDALKLGESNLLQMGYDHIGEMSLLNLAARHEKVDFFPVFPSMCNSDQSFVFDPASYGQLLAGNNNGDGPGFMNAHSGYFVAIALSEKQIQLKFENKKPSVYQPNTDECRDVFNLHIHRKTLSDFAIEEVLYD